MLVLPHTDVESNIPLCVGLSELVMLAIASRLNESITVFRLKIGTQASEMCEVLSR